MHSLAKSFFDNIESFSATLGLAIVAIREPVSCTIFVSEDKTQRGIKVLKGIVESKDNNFTAEGDFNRNFGGGGGNVRARDVDVSKDEILGILNTGIGKTAVVYLGKSTDEKLRTDENGGLFVTTLHDNKDVNGAIVVSRSFIDDVYGNFSIEEADKILKTTVYHEIGHTQEQYVKDHVKDTGSVSIPPLNREEMADMYAVDRMVSEGNGSRQEMLSLMKKGHQTAVNIVSQTGVVDVSNGSIDAMRKSAKVSLQSLVRVIEDRGQKDSYFAQSDKNFFSPAPSR